MRVGVDAFLGDLVSDNSELSVILAAIALAYVTYVLVERVAAYVARRSALAVPDEERARWQRWQERVGPAVIFYTVAVFVSIVLALYLIDRDALLEGLVAAFAITAFMRFQLPRLLQPRVELVFHHWDTAKQDYVERAVQRDELHEGDIAGGMAVILPRLINTGLTMYENCSCAVTIPRRDGVALEILDYTDGCSEPIYRMVDFSKPFHLQRHNNAALFSPHDNYQTLHHGDSIWLPLVVRLPAHPAPSQVNHFDLRVEFSSASAWFHKTLAGQVALGVEAG